MLKCLRQQRVCAKVQKGYHQVGGKGIVTPLLKGKVQIPPSAGHFIDPLVQRNFVIDPPLLQEKKSMVHVQINKNVPQNCNIKYFSTFLNPLKKCLFWGSFSNFTVPFPPPAGGKIRILPPCRPLFSPLLPWAGVVAPCMPTYVFLALNVSHHAGRFRRLWRPLEDNGDEQAVLRHSGGLDEVT